MQTQPILSQAVVEIFFQASVPYAGEDCFEASVRARFPAMFGVPCLANPLSLLVRGGGSCYNHSKRKEESLHE